MEEVISAQPHINHDSVAPEGERGDFDKTI